MSQLRPIPRIIHQSWKDDNIPHDKYPQSWIDSWTQTHPGWKRMFWTDHDNEELVRIHYPQFYDFYISLSPTIKQADFVRFLYLDRFGGVYVDLDFVCLRNIEPLLTGHEIVLGRLSSDNDYYQIPNAFMASCASHGFWIKTAWDAMRAPPAEQRVETLAGPFRLQWSFQKYQPEHSAVYGDGLIYPFDWIHFTDWRGGKYFREDRKKLATDLEGRTPREMAEALPEAFCVTFWVHNW